MGGSRAKIWLLSALVLLTGSFDALVALAAGEYFLFRLDFLIIPKLISGIVGSFMLIRGIKGARIAAAAALSIPLAESIVIGYINTSMWVPGAVPYILSAMIPSGIGLYYALFDRDISKVGKVDPKKLERGLEWTSYSSLAASALLYAFVAHSPIIYITLMASVSVYGISTMLYALMRRPGYRRESIRMLIIVSGVPFAFLFYSTVMNPFDADGLDGLVYMFIFFAALLFSGSYFLTDIVRSRRRGR